MTNSTDIPEGFPLISVSDDAQGILLEGTPIFRANSIKDPDSIKDLVAFGLFALLQRDIEHSANAGYSAEQCEIEILKTILGYANR